MFKKIGLLILILLLFTGTGTAHASINGSYNGYSIINVVVNGVLIKSDVPAIQLNGRTMVPLRFVSEAMGANINWDGNTETSYVNTSTSSGTLTSQHTDSDIEKIKLYNKIADYYRVLAVLGDNINLTSNSFSILVGKYLALNDFSYYDTAVESFGTTIDRYNYLIGANEVIMTEAEEAGIDISDTVQILDFYYTAIDNYRNAFENIFDFYRTGKQDYFSLYLFSNETGFNNASHGVLKAIDSYYYFHNLIQNY